jgi:hypothetical protein
MRRARLSRAFCSPLIERWRFAKVRHLDSALLFGSANEYGNGSRADRRKAVDQKAPSIRCDGILEKRCARRDDFRLKESMRTSWNQLAVWPS